MSSRELAILAGGTPDEVESLTIDQQVAAAWHNLAEEHPFFFDPDFPIPTPEKDQPTHEVQADRRTGDRRRKPRLLRRRKRHHKRLNG